MKMSDKKNIDRLFQEKFKDFEMTPDDSVWKKIQAQKNKDKKRVLLIPFWYRIAGVAALIAVLFSVGSFLLPNNNAKDAILVMEEVENQNSTTPTPNDAVVNTPEDKKSTNTDGTSENRNTNNEAITENSIKNQDNKDSSIDILEDKESLISNTSKNNLQDKNITHEKTIKTTNSLEDNTSIVTSTTKEKENTLFKKPSNTGNAVVSTSKTNTSTNSKENISINKEEAISENEVVKNQISNEDPLKNSAKKEAIYPQNSFKNNTSNVEAIADNIDKEKSADQALDPLDDSGKKSIFDVIEEKEQKKTIVAETTLGKRWNVSPNVAPVYYDSFSGSSVDPEFSDNNKQGQVNLSYGIQVAYAINKKLSIRSGVSKVDVGYNTEDIGFGISAVAREFELGNSTLGSNVQNLVVSDFRNIPSGFSQSPPPGGVNNEILIKSQNPGLLNHSIGYIEVPLELKYALTSSKIGIHMIGGISTLFLENDEVSVIAGSFRNENVIRDDTVNDISFSGNIGLGFDYKLSDQFKLNMEPIFKYQFNGFKENAENFRPYYFGVFN